MRAALVRHPARDAWVFRSVRGCFPRAEAAAGARVAPRPPLRRLAISASDQPEHVALVGCRAGAVPRYWISRLSPGFQWSAVCFLPVTCRGRNSPRPFIQCNYSQSGGGGHNEEASQQGVDRLRGASGCSNHSGRKNEDDHRQGRQSYGSFSQGEQLCRRPASP